MSETKLVSKNISVSQDEEVHVVIYKRRMKFADEFSMVFQKACFAIPQMGLTATALNVFIFLLGNMDFKNAILVTQKTIGDHIGVKRQNIHKAMQELEIKGVIIKHEKTGSINSYRLNREVAWKGSAKEHKKNK
jgi:hypothetical protein